MQNAKMTLKTSCGKRDRDIKYEEKADGNLNLYRQKFIEAMDDDLNTADAISVEFELIKQVNSYVKDGCSKEFAERSLFVLNELTGVLGLLRDKDEGTLDEEIDRLVAERQDARSNRDFKRADEIRDILIAKGIILKDTPQGVQIIRE